MVDRHIQVDFVAGGTKFRRLQAHKGLEERAAVRLGIQAHDKVVQGPDHGIFACSQLVQLGIFEKEVALAHGALHFHDAVTHQAAQARAGFGTIHNFPDGRVEQPAVEQRGIVAAGAPLRGLYAGDVLHVFDTLAIPLIVEGREVVHRTVPLGVNVRVATLAGVRFHEILRGYVDVVNGLRGTGKEFS